MMRRLLACIAVAGLGVLITPAVVSATPTVAFTMRAVPIPGFPHTGNILGAGAAATLDFTIGGSEYFGDAPPVIGFRFYAPAGGVVNVDGWPTCSEETLDNIGPSGCPNGSKAGPIGAVLGYVTFGEERVEETAKLYPFFRPGGGLEYFAVGLSPVDIEAMATGRFSHLGGIDGYGFEEEEEVPLIATVPDGPDASIKAITGRFGGATKLHGKPIYYFRLPKSCPPGGFPLKAEVTFAEGGDPSKPETVSAYSSAPCPRR
jgi:hypothetical protein